MPVSIIGASYVSSNSAGPWTVVLPVGTTLGDTLVLITFSEDWSTTDTRLDPLPIAAGIGGYLGIATTLDDIEVSSTFFTYTMLYLVVMRDMAPVPEFSEVYDTLVGGMEYPPERPAPAIAGVAVMRDGTDTLTPSIGPDPADLWTAFDEVTLVHGGINDTMRAFAFVGTPVPALEPVEVPGEFLRRQTWTVYFEPAAPARSILRLHQSPLWAPSRNRPVDLRQRQTPYVT